MKKTITLLTALLLMLAVCCGACAESYSVGICQLMVHDSLDQATQGFTDALTQEMEAAGHTVEIDTQVAGDASLCTTCLLYTSISVFKCTALMYSSKMNCLPKPLTLCPKGNATLSFCPTSWI